MLLPFEGPAGQGEAARRYQIGGQQLKKQKADKSEYNKMLGALNDRDCGDARAVAAGSGETDGSWVDDACEQLSTSQPALSQTVPTPTSTRFHPMFLRLVKRACERLSA